MATLVQEFFSQFQHNVTGYVSAALAITGLAFLTKSSLGVLTAFLRIFILSGQSLRKFGPKGSWALVTGASDGIGKEYALQLAQKGFNIILVSRTESKLLALSNEIESKNAEQGIKAKVLAMDFAKNSDSDYQRLSALIDGLDIAILVNNVGQSHDIPTTFLQTPKSAIDDIITINVLGTLRITQLVAPGMAQRKRGLILTMGSFGGLMPTPLLATYSGSKAFLQHWSTALGSELKLHGVEVQLIISYLVTSAMSKIRRPSMTIPTPKAFVRAALSRVGVNVGGLPGTMTPFWAHAVMHWVIENTLGIGSTFLLNTNRKMHEDIRAKALRKKERESKKN